MLKKVLESIKVIYKKGLVHILVGSFMTKLVAMFGSIFLVRILTKEEYGVLGYLENIYGYVLVLAGMGMANVVLRYVVLGDTVQKKYTYFRYSFNMAWIWNVFLIVFVGAIFLFYPHKAEYQKYAWLLNIMFFMLPLQNTTELLLCNERAMFSNHRYAFLSLLLSVMVIVGKIIAGTVAGIRAVVFVQFAVYGVMAIFFYFVSNRKYYHDVQRGDKLERNERSVINKYAIQYMITNGLWTIFMLNDTFLLGRYCDPSVLADYRVAYTIPGCVNIISTALGVFLAPYFVRNEKNIPWIRRHFKLSYCAIAGIIGIVCLLIASLAKPIVWLLYGTQYLNIVPVMRILLLATFFNCGLRYTTANLLAAMGKIKYNMLISIIGMALQIGINLFLVPRFGVIGVAITSCIVYLFMAVALFIIFVYRYFINRNVSDNVD